MQPHPMMWIGLGLVLEEKGAWGEAREAYRAALEVGAHPEAQLGLVWCAAMPALVGVGGHAAATPAAVGGEEALLGEALAHALMAHAQRPAHVQGAVLLGELLLAHAR